MYDCEGEAQGELSFVEGQILELIGKTCPHGDGWWIGKTAAGTMGIFPENYVEVRFIIFRRIRQCSTSKVFEQSCSHASLLVTLFVS